MTHFAFERRDALFPAPAAMPGPGPYYTCLVDMRGVESFPFDNALYFSTDHDPGQGGLWLAVGNGAPTDPAGWRSYDDAVTAGAFDHVADRPAANPIFLDTVQGTGHTETPHVNVVDGTVVMTYHRNGIEGTQRTLLATSANGVTFARLHGDDDSVILRHAPGQRPGNGHTGYFRWAPNPFAGIPHRFVGYSLHGGGDDYHSAIWGSDDARVWACLDVLAPYEGHAMPDDMILIWHEIDPASITPIGGGEYVAIAGGGNRASGGVRRITELYEITLADDGRTLTRQSRPLLGRRPGHDDAEELSSPTSLVVDGTRHLVYVGTRDGAAVNTILGATGGVDPSAKKAEPLPAPQRTRHRVPHVTVEAVHRITDDGLHNAFTDLVRFGGRFYLTFRSCPDGHMVFPTSRIRVLCSDDGISDWREVFTFAVDGRDVRDPHFLVLGDRLFVISGTWLCEPEGGEHRDMNDHLGYGANTADGQTWEGPRMLEGTYGHYVWRAAAHGGRGWLCGRRRRGFVPAEGESRSDLIESALLTSDDGWTWRFAGRFTPSQGDETAFLFEDDGTILALVRGAGTTPARISRLHPPYTEPARLTDLDRNVGGPLLARWGDGLLVAGRDSRTRGQPVTQLCWLAGDRLHECARLPSGGDNSYPGFVDLGDGRGLLSWYSSHEGSGTGAAPAHVYVALLRRG